MCTHIDIYIYTYVCIYIHIYIWIALSLSLSLSLLINIYIYFMIWAREIYVDCAWMYAYTPQHMHILYFERMCWHPVWIPRQSQHITEQSGCGACMQIRSSESGDTESSQGPSDCCKYIQSDALPTELSPGWHVHHGEHAPCRRMMSQQSDSQH